MGSHGRLVRPLAAPVNLQREEYDDEAKFSSYRLMLRRKGCSKHGYPMGLALSRASRFYCCLPLKSHVSKVVANLRQCCVKFDVIDL